jgi:hypothetical protein
MKLQNITDSTQYINTIDGGAYVSMPNEAITINEKIIYKEELERALPFFKVISDGKLKKEEFKDFFPKTKKEIKSEGNNG